MTYYFDIAPRRERMIYLRLPHISADASMSDIFAQSSRIYARYADASRPMRDYSDASARRLLRPTRNSFSGYIATPSLYARYTDEERRDTTIEMPLGHDDWQRARRYSFI